MHRHHQDSHWHAAVESVHVKDLHEAKLVENCIAGKYFKWWQSLLLDLTCNKRSFQILHGINPPQHAPNATELSELR